MNSYQPEAGFREALTQLDAGEVDLIVTPSAEVAEWAEQNGYRIVRASQGGVPIYEIRPGQSPL